MGKLEVVLSLRLILVSNILNEKVEPWMGGLFLFLLRLFDEKRTDECVPSPGPCALACRLGKDTTHLFFCCRVHVPDCSFLFISFPSATV